MKFEKTIKIVGHYNCEQLPEDWQNKYGVEDLEIMIDESIDSRAEWLMSNGYVEGEWIDNINTDIDTQTSSSV